MASVSFPNCTKHESEETLPALALVDTTLTFHTCSAVLDQAISQNIEVEDLVHHHYADTVGTFELSAVSLKFPTTKSTSNMRKQIEYFHFHELIYIIIGN